MKKRHAGVKILLLLLVCGGVVLPSAVSAQSGPQYGYNPASGASYLLPNRNYQGRYPYGGATVAQGISATCAPMQLTGAVGQPVIWFSSVTGGDGTYVYSWSGAENLAGNAGTAQKIYDASGEKFAALSVTSAGKTVTVSCGAMQIAPSAPVVAQLVLGASCYAAPEKIAPGESATWLSIVSGANAAASYAWDGTDNLSGDRPLVSKTYEAAGPKFALLTVTSGSARVVAACTNRVVVAPKAVAAQKPAGTPPPIQAEAPDIRGLCSSSAATAGIGEKVLWQVVAVGGAGEYRYRWSGDDALAGDGSTTEKIYEDAGAKQASVTVRSGEKTATIACAPVEVIKKQTGLLAATFFSWLGNSLFLSIAGVVTVIAAGAYIARRKNAKEEEPADEEDYKPAN